MTDNQPQGDEETVVILWPPPGTQSAEKQVQVTIRVTGRPESVTMADLLAGAATQV